MQRVPLHSNDVLLHASQLRPRKAEVDSRVRRAAQQLVQKLNVQALNRVAVHGQEAVVHQHCLVLVARLPLHHAVLVAQVIDLQNDEGRLPRHLKSHIGLLQGHAHRLPGVPGASDSESVQCAAEPPPSEARLSLRLRLN